MNAAGDDDWADSSASLAAFGQPVLSNGVPAGPASYRTAVLNGNLVSGWPAPNVTIYWGANSNNWANTNALGPRAPGVLFWTMLSGLSESTLYYYRCYATNSYGQSWSAPVAFTTRSSVPIFAGGSCDGYASDAQVTGIVPIRGTVLMAR